VGADFNRDFLRKWSRLKTAPTPKIAKQAGTKPVGVCSPVTLRGKLVKLRILISLKRRHSVIHDGMKESSICFGSP
jgi:hypothetical protein